MKKRRAFTLVEMLVVIAIIGIVAAMVVGMNNAAKAKQRDAQVNGEKQALILAIDSYQSKLNFYPPDNGFLINQPAGMYYDAYASTNPLLYELTGGTNIPPNIVLFDGTNTSANFNTVFNRVAINNGNPDEPHDFFQSGPQRKEYTNYDNVTQLEGLLVPVPFSPTSPINFWHYDSSTTNRHNQSSYDLWAEYVVPGKSGLITTNGNW